MGEDALYDAMFIDPLTHVQNRRAYDYVKPKPDYIAIIDLDSLKWVNDNKGHRAGDSLLMRLGAMLVTAFGEDQVYRISGDEFVVAGDSIDELDYKLSSLQMESNIFSFGAGTNLDEADAQLRKYKSVRVLHGLRANRGDMPPWENIQ